MRNILTWVLFGICHGIWAQDAPCSIRGFVVDNNNLPLAEQPVYLVEQQQIAYTDTKGYFEFNSLPRQVYHLYAVVDFSPLEITEVSFQTDDIQIIRLKIASDITLLNPILIQTKKKSELLQHAAIKSDVIDVQKNAEKAMSVEELVSRAPGVKIRNTGGLGANSTLIVGGFTGNAVKLLYDDIPIDYLGSCFGLTKMPTNMISHIEVYKGVLPTKIGVDALGGAINIIPLQAGKTKASIAYETGSFATHIATLNAHIRLSDHWHLGTNSFYNYSKNNFKVDDLPYVDSKTGNTTYIQSELFHNSFEQASTQFYVQGRDWSWADKIELTVHSYQLTKDIQNDSYSRARAFGAVYRKEKGRFIPSLKYDKRFFNQRLSWNQFFVYSQLDFELFDTAKNVFYDWKGREQPTVSASEMGNPVVPKGYLINTLKQFTTRTNLNYLLTDALQLESNTVYSDYKRQSNIEDIHTNGTNYRKFITSMAVNGSFWNKKLASNTQLKYLLGQLKSSVQSFDNPLLLSVQKQQLSDKTGVSFSQAFKYVFNDQHYLRVSYENTYRLPNQEELFGDNNFIVANYELKPERSQNINWGYTYNNSRLTAELNMYYRDTEDLIRVKDLNQYQAVFLNLDHVKGLGLELDLSYRPASALMLTANLTWNDFRLQSSKDATLQNTHYKNARIANLPFYYTNVGASYNFKDLLAISSDLTWYWHYSYIHQYYLDFIERQFEPDGLLGLWGRSKINTNRIIPVQHLNNTGVVYQKNLRKQTIAISGEIKNIFNEAIFNEFKMQSPGRNYRLKLTYSF